METSTAFPPKITKASKRKVLHPGRLTWNIQMTHLERNMIFQTSMIMFHVNLQGCTPETKKASLPLRIHGWKIPRQFRPIYVLSVRFFLLLLPGKSMVGSDVFPIEPVPF